MIKILGIRRVKLRYSSRHTRAILLLPLADNRRVLPLKRTAHTVLPGTGSNGIVVPCWSHPQPSFQVVGVWTLGLYLLGFSLLQ